METKPRFMLQRSYLVCIGPAIKFLNSTFSVLLIVVGFISLAGSNFQDTLAQQDQGFELYQELDFGVTLERPSDWTLEGDNVWLHSDINPWHLPLIPIKELQPTAVDILLEGKKTLLVDFTEQEDDTLTLIRVSVEKTPFGVSSLDSYAQHVLERINRNNDNVQVVENSKTSMAGNPAIRLVISYGDAEYAARTIQILTLYGNLAYVFQYDSSGEYYEANLAIAQHVFDSVSISPPVSRAQILFIAMIGIGVAAAAVIGVNVRKKGSLTIRFLGETKRLFPSAFGIEVLCVASAEIGGFLGLWYYGFNAFGITMAYVLAYALAGFTTFASILGRSAHAHDEDEIICGCAGMTEHGHDTNTGFGKGIKETFVNFAIGLKMMPRLHRKANAKRIVKASLVVLISAESGCIIAAATVDIILYQYSVFLSIPLALLAGTLTVAAIAAYKSTRKGFVEKSSRQH